MGKWGEPSIYEKLSCKFAEFVAGDGEEDGEEEVEDDAGGGADPGQGEGDGVEERAEEVLSADGFDG